MLSRNPADSISEIATLCGFDSPSNFSKVFKRFYNCTPREYRRTVRNNTKEDRQDLFCGEEIGKDRQNLFCGEETGKETCR